MSDLFTALATRPIIYSTPEWLPESTWYMHAPFAFLCMDMLRPHVLVELGTQTGMSYCSFCQAAAELGLPTQAWAVDHWRGDEHTGAYASNTLEVLRAHHDPRYGSFSTLVRSTFDEALPSFKDGSIDLLHIDGLHTYEAVRHDFEAWLPKLSARAVVLFHDTEERIMDFGVWRLWEEVASVYPSLNFPFGHGLGVAAIGPDAPPLLLDLCALNMGGKSRIYSFFQALGERVSLYRALNVATEEKETARAELDQVYQIHSSTQRSCEEQLAAAQAQMDALRESSEDQLAAARAQIELVQRSAEEQIAAAQAQMDASRRSAEDQLSAAAIQMAHLANEVKTLQDTLRTLRSERSLRQAAGDVG